MSTAKIQATLLDTLRGRRVVLTIRGRHEVELTMSETEALAADLVDIVETRPMVWADAEMEAARVREDAEAAAHEEWMERERDIHTGGVA